MQAAGHRIPGCLCPIDSRIIHTGTSQLDRRLRINALHDKRCAANSLKLVFSESQRLNASICEAEIDFTVSAADSVDSKKAAEEFLTGCLIRLNHVPFADGIGFIRHVFLLVLRQ